MSTAMVPGAGSRWQREAGIDDGPEQFVADIMAKTDGEADEVLAHALAEVSAPLVEWLADGVGLPLSLVTDFDYPGHSRQRCHTVPGRSGRAMLQDLVTGRAAEPAHRADGAGRAGRRPRRGRPGAWRRRAVGVAAGGDPHRRRSCSPPTGTAPTADLVAAHIPEIAGAVYHGSEASRGRRPAPRPGARRAHRLPRRLPGARRPRDASSDARRLGDRDARRRAGRPSRATLRRRDARLLGVRQRSHPARGRRGVDRPRPAHRRAVPSLPGLRRHPGLGGGALGRRRARAGCPGRPRPAGLAAHPGELRSHRRGRPGGRFGRTQLGGAARAAVRRDRGAPRALPHPGRTGRRRICARAATSRVSRSRVSTPPAALPRASPATARADTWPATGCFLPWGWPTSLPSPWQPPALVEGYGSNPPTT